MDDAIGKYRAYLVRIWDAGRPGVALWRVSLQDVQTGVRRGFPDLERLYTFLVEQIADAADEHPQPQTPVDRNDPLDAMEGGDQRERQRHTDDQGFG